MSRSGVLRQKGNNPGSQGGASRVTEGGYYELFNAPLNGGYIETRSHLYYFPDMRLFIHPPKFFCIKSCIDILLLHHSVAEDKCFGPRAVMSGDFYFQDNNASDI